MRGWTTGHKQFTSKLPSTSPAEALLRSPKDMFGHLTLDFIKSPDFKEDSVRELVILPILNRLGYSAMGEAGVKRSKTLQHPFIRVGTTNHPVNIIPDYTLCYKEKPIFILDAKSPSQDVLDPKHLQQAYSYAIHPEVKTREFGLCNGSHLAVFSIDSSTPLLHLGFQDFEEKWQEIEKALLPDNLLNPVLRQYQPDFGMKIARLGVPRSSSIHLPGVRLNTFAKLDEENYMVATACDFLDEPHMVSFDFPAEMLESLLEGLPEQLRDEFSAALRKFPFQACAGLHLEVDLKTRLGDLQICEMEQFIPLIIEEVSGSRFVPIVENGEPEGIPPHVYQLHKHFKIAPNGE
ncbi:MAG: hypothetical protein ABIS50_05000 [Luteolibacter sp.]